MESKQTLGEVAEQYVPEKTKVISDLDEVSIDLTTDIYVGVGDDGKTFNYYYIVVGDVKYRVPQSVLSQLKVFRKEKPDMKLFKVNRVGTGITDTRYTVIPL